VDLDGVQKLGPFKFSVAVARSNRSIELLFLLWNAVLVVHPQPCNNYVINLSKDEFSKFSEINEQ